MKRYRLLSLRILLMIICLYHLMLGILPFLPKSVALKAAILFFGMDISTSVQMEYMSKLFGIYAGMFGLFMGLCAIDPVRYRLILCVSLFLFLIRLVLIVVSFDTIGRAFNVPAFKLWQCAINFVVIGASLFFLLPRKNTQQ